MPGMQHRMPQPRQDRLPRRTKRTLVQRVMKWHRLCPRPWQNILTPTGAHAIVARFLACFIEQIYNLNVVEFNQKEE